MNCKDYQEAIAADPSQQFDGATHAAACESCATYRDEILVLDRTIAGALDIAVPELKLPQLPTITDDDSRVVNLPFGRGRLRTSAWIGLAASVLFATVLGVRFFSGDVTYASLADEIVAHMDHEPYSLQVTDKAVSKRALAKVIGEHITAMDAGLITYANSCVINGNTIPHLVIQGERGPVTLLLLPNEMIDSAVPLQGIGITGIILPVGDGSIAIIGERDEPLDKIEKRLASSVKWST
jgi:Protein of unknown function (DUF3379)